MILRRVAVADPAEFGFGLMVFVIIQAPGHSAGWRDGFAKSLAGLPQVVEAWGIAGDVAYLPCRGAGHGCL